MATKRRSGRPRGEKRRYGAIAMEISRRLASKEWNIGERLPSYREFAREFDVSIGSIQNAFKLLRAEGWVDIRPRRLVTAALGAQVSTLMEGAIAVVFPAFGETYVQLLSGIVARSHRMGPAIVLLGHGRWKVRFPAGLCDLPLRGVLLAGPLKQRLLRQYSSLNAPVILLDQPGEGHNLHSISVANFDAAHDATTRLIRLGHERLAFLRYVVPSLQDIDPDSKERQAGFVAACRDAGIKESDYATFTASNIFTGTQAEAAKILQTIPRFTALLTACEEQAAQVEAVAKSIKLRIPHDLSVATFRAASPTAVDWSGPRIDFSEFGRLAVDLLERHPTTIQDIRVQTEWHAGSTVARAPAVQD